MGWVRRAKVGLGRRAAPLLRSIGAAPEVTTFSESLPESPSGSANDLEAAWAGHPSGFRIPVSPGETLERTSSHFHRGTDRETFLAKIPAVQTGLVHRSTPEFVACIPEGRIVTDCLLVMGPERTLYRDSMPSDAQFARKGFAQKVRFPREQRLDGSYATLAMHWWDCYYHWIFDALPRLATLDAVPALTDVPILVPRTLRGYQRESLELLGIDPARLVPFDPGHIVVDRLFVPSLPRPSGNPTARATGWLRDRLLPSEVGDADAMLYVSRRDTPKRRILDEPELERRLAARGFTIVCPGDHSFAEQIELFSRAKVVVGAHGSGIANTLFSPPGLRVLELFSAAHIEGCYWALANVLGFEHGLLIGEKVEKHVRIDFDTVESLVEEMLEERS